MIGRVAVLFAAAALLLVGASASSSSSDVLILGPTNFDDYVGGDLPVFVEFFAPSANTAKHSQQPCVTPPLLS